MTQCQESFPLCRAVCVRPHRSFATVQSKVVPRKTPARPANYQTPHEAIGELPCGAARPFREHPECPQIVPANVRRRTPARGRIRNTGSGSVRGQGVCPCLQNPIPLGQEICEPRAEWIGCSSSRGGVAESSVRRLIWSLLRKSKMFHAYPLREPGAAKRGCRGASLASQRKRMLPRRRPGLGWPRVSAAHHTRQERGSGRASWFHLQALGGGELALVGVEGEEFARLEM